MVLEIKNEGKNKDTDLIVRKQVSFEIKTVEEKEENSNLYVGSFSGLASTFGNVDLGDDIIQQGAFKPAIKVMDKTGKLPKALMQHNSRQDQGAIFTTVKETAEGLFVEGKFINTDRGKNLRVEVMTGAISDFSIGFRIGKYEMDEETGVRTIIEIRELPEISFVTFPMNPEANILDAKSRPENERDFEKLLRDNGYSRDEAKGIISKGLKALQRDAEGDKQREAEEKQKEIDDKKAEEAKAAEEAEETKKANEAKAAKEAKYAEFAESFNKIIKELKGK